MRQLRTKSRKNQQLSKSNNQFKNTTNKKTNNKFNNVKQSKIKQSSRREKFEDDVKKVEEAPDDLVDFLKVSVEDNKDGDYIPLHEREYNSETDRYLTYFKTFIMIFIKYSLMVFLMVMNFLALSISLNCNAGEEFFKRIISAVFAFFFGFIYLLVNYYTYRVLVKGQMCKMNRDKLFPFTA